MLSSPILTVIHSPNPKGDTHRVRFALTAILGAECPHSAGCRWCVADASEIHEIYGTVSEGLTYI